MLDNIQQQMCITMGKIVGGSIAFNMYIDCHVKNIDTQDKSLINHFMNGQYFILMLYRRKIVKIVNIG